jgi:hypothetical protein
MGPQDIYRYAATVLQRHLQWSDYSPKCTVTAVLQILFYAAAQLCWYWFSLIILQLIDYQSNTEDRQPLNSQYLLP